MADTVRTAPGPVASGAATQDVLPPAVASYLNAMGFPGRPPVRVPWSPATDCQACKGPAAAAPPKSPAVPPATRGAAVTLSPRSRGRGTGGRRRAAARGRTEAPLTTDFQSATNQIGLAAKQQRTHPAATTKRTEVERSARLPEKEQQDQSSKERNTGKMGEVGQQRLSASRKFSAETFINELHERVEKGHPETEDDARSMAKRDAVHIEEDFTKQIATEQGTVIDPLKQQASDPKIAGFDAPKKPVPIPAPAYPAAPGRVDPALVTPKPKPDPEVSLQAESDRLDGAMTKNRLSDDQLAQSREPSFLNTLKTKQEAHQKIVEARAAYRRQESTVLQGATSQANQSLSSGLTGMNRTHTRIGGGVLGSQKGTESQTQKRQREIKETIDNIYKRTVDCVKCALETMTTRATSEFTKSLEAETETFNSRVRDRLDSYYSFGKKAKHFFFGEPKVVVNENGSTRDLTRDDYEGEFPLLHLKKGVKWINPDVYAIFLEEKKRFLAKMDAQLVTIAEDVQIGLTTANEKIEEGRKEVANYVKTLHGDELRYAKGLQEDVFTKFENLEGTIDDAREDLLNTLADQYRESINKLETTFNEINDELKKTWIDRAIDFVETVGKTIFQLAELLFSILVRIAYLVWDIVKHPIRFFETLVTGLKDGISSFIGDIGTHLQEAFWTWLTDAAPGKAIRLSLGSGVAGLFDLVMQVLSLTAADLRAIVDKILGPEFMQLVDKGVAFAEKVFEPVIILVKKGPVAFWDYIKEQLGDLIQSTFDRVKESVFFAVIKRGIIWIAGFFVPGGGFVKIVKAIVKAFQFVAENLDRIRMFFDSIFDSMEAATQGNPSGVASKIIAGLKMGIVLALSFLATQLGLGDIIDKVHKILHALRRPIVNAIEWILRKVKPFATRIVATAKKVGTAVVQAGLPKDPAERLRLGLRAAIAAVNALRGSVVTATVINSVLRAIKIRYGFVTLEPVAIEGEWWIEGEINPTAKAKARKKVSTKGISTDVAAPGQMTIQRLVVPRPVNDRDRPTKMEIARATSGRAWQDAMNSAVVREILVPQWEIVLQVPIEIVVRGQKAFAYPSRLDLARLKIDRGHKAGRAGVIPDITMEVRQPSGTGLREVRLVEITLVEDFTTRGDFARHKISQFTSDVQIMLEKYGKDVPVTYVFLAPRPPTIPTEQFIVNILHAHGATNFTVRWLVVEQQPMQPTSA